MKNTLCLFVCGLAPIGALEGAVIDSGLLAGGAIPDNGNAAFRWTYAGAPELIAGLTLSVSLSGAGGGGAYIGDLYATLRHSSGGATAFAVLLNRVGRTEAGAYGYADDGLSVTFDDRVGAPDIHTYRLAAPSGAISGVWGTDGRAVDPATVASDSPRATSLLDFVGLDPNGEWLLYIADLSAGGYAKLDSWRLEIETMPIPEPVSGALLLSLGLAGFGWLRRARAAS